jgi:MYXO-CTERM domain-containing protein
MRAGFVALGFASFVVLAPATAHAHFYVDFPDSGMHTGPSPQPWWQQDSLGSPQKLGPCGDEDDATQGSGGPTGAVTPYAPGQTITLQWTEIISHAGWFRIAVAADRSQFVDPPVQVDSNGNSADAGIENPPVAPVIADGVYKHPIGALKTWPPYQITLPTTPCAKCTIQIIQVMLDHPSNLGNLPDGAPNPDGFLYHHCIDISIGATDGGSGSGSGGSSGSGGASSSGSGGSSGSGSGGNSPDAGAGSSGTGSGSGSGGGGNGEAPASSSSGCGCTAGAAPAAGGLLSLLGLAVLVRRRRGRRPVR